MVNPYVCISRFGVFVLVVLDRSVHDLHELTQSSLFSSVLFSDVSGSCFQSKQNNTHYTTCR